MRLTASRIALARSCAWWARPDVEVPASEASKAAELGTALHAVAEQESEEVDGELVDETFRHLTWQAEALEPEMGLEEASTPSRELAASLRPADRVALEQLVAAWRAWWATWSKDVEVVGREVPFAIDVATGGARRLPSNGQRDYSAATETEIPGTTDLVVRRDRRLVVLDYKTGFGEHRYRDHEEQMRFLGAAAALAHDEHEVLVIVAHVTADGVRLSDPVVLDSLDIAVVVHELRELAAGVDGAVAKPGLHCEDDWCPAKSICPVTRALLVDAKVSLDGRTRLPIVGPIRTNDEALATLVAVDLVEAWLEERKRAAREYADKSPVRAPDGRVYRGRPVRRESPKLEVDGAEDVLMRVLGPDVADAAVKVTRKASWTSIKAAVRAARAEGRDVPVGDTEEHVRAALREAGALKVSEFTSYEWKAER